MNCHVTRSPVTIPLLTLLVVMLSLLAPPVSAGTTGPDYAAIDRYLAAQIVAAHIPGAALGIGHGTRIVHLYGAGHADAASHAVTPRRPSSSAR